MRAVACPATWTRHAGDTNDFLVVQVSKSLGDTLDAVLSVSGVLEDVNGVIADVPLTAAVSDSAAREVTVQLGSWLQSTAQPGERYWVSLDISVGASVIRFPEKPSKRLGLHIV